MPTTNTMSRGRATANSTTAAASAPRNREKYFPACGGVALVRFLAEVLVFQFLIRVGESSEESGLTTPAAKAADNWRPRTAALKALRHPKANPSLSASKRFRRVRRVRAGWFLRNMYLVFPCHLHAGTERNLLHVQ